LHAGKGSDLNTLAELVRTEIELPSLADDGLLAEPLFGCWEGNMNHALLRKPVDVCRLRGEPWVIVGNSGVVRILQVGPAVRDVVPGQIGMLFCGSVVDEWGYTKKAFAYDSPKTMGCLATRMVLRRHEYMPIPQPTRHSLAQWAAFSARYVTAWSNWELAHGTFRLLISRPELPAPHVWGWGGGTTLAELDLARRAECQTVMLSGNDRRLQLIERAGVTPLDRRQFGELNYDEARFASDANYRRAYTEAEKAFLNEVARRTSGGGVHIFLDYIGTPVFRATLKALAREGVIATAGWKEGMVISFLRAMECIERHQHIHTHFARPAQALAAIAFGEASGWMPSLEDEEIVPFDAVPQLARRFFEGDCGFFPVFSINAC
jgi:NADPH:quinone reductase-like Zn-dependent oxidoreductase